MLWYLIIASGQAWDAYLALPKIPPKDLFDGKVRITEAYRNLLWGWGALAATVAGIFGFGLAFWRSHSQFREANLNERRQMAEAFATAIEQLGHDKFSIRIGGILTLEKIAQVDLAYHRPVMETLCAYVRNERPFNPLNVETIPVDIQTILTVLGRREYSNDGEKGLIDLHKCNLLGANMQNGQFSGALLFGSSLSGANLWQVNLEQADLQGAHLIKANLIGANLKRAIAEGADFSRSDMTRASLEMAIAMRTNFDKSNMWMTNIKGAHFFLADFENTRLLNPIFDSTTDIAGVDFSNVSIMPKEMKTTCQSDGGTKWPKHFAPRHNT